MIKLCKTCKVTGKHTIRWYFGGKPIIICMKCFWSNFGCYAEYLR